MLAISLNSVIRSKFFHRFAISALASAPLLAAYHTKIGLGLGSLLLKWINTISLVLLPIRHYHLRAQIQWLDIHCEHLVNLLLGNLMTRHSIMDATPQHRLFPFR